MQYASIMRTVVLVMLIYAAADALPLDKEIGTGGVGTPDVAQKASLRSRFPHIGPRSFISDTSEARDKRPANAAPDKKPSAAMPPLPFMTPMRAEEAKREGPVKPVQPLTKKFDPAPATPR